jgi:hypothetical protein
MAHKEYGVTDILDILRRAQAGDSIRRIFNRTFQEYSQHRGFIIDPAPVRHPEAKGCVENQIKYVRDNFFAGEEFSNREHAQRTALTWCRATAGLRLHGTTRKRPLLVFEEEEQKTLLPLLRTLLFVRGLTKILRLRPRQYLPVSALPLLMLFV